MALGVGTRLGAYEITGDLGAGGMGEVYRATDTKLGREVAIKTLPAALAGEKDRLARFEREAKLLAALNHAHIASVYNLDEQDGTLYLAMELVEGETLEQKLKAGPLPTEDALRLGLQIAEALEAAHEKGVVHRDLKPANIMVTADGRVKVLDFGLAKAFSGDPNQATPAHSPALSVAMTQQGLILGTAGYMSPEQASGQATDQRADIWAFGVVLFEMLTGLPLFSGESVPHILAAVLQTEPDWSRLPKKLHPRLRQLLERCLEKKVRNRYHSIADVRVDIEKVLSDPQGAEPTEPTLSPPGLRRAWQLVAAAVVLTAAATALIAWSLRPAPQPAPVDTFAYPLGAAQNLRRVGRPVMALSPDGRRFVYNTTDGLYLRSMDDLTARPIPGTQEALVNPFFSPDGQSVAYYTPPPRQLKRIGISGGVPVVIADDVSDALGASWGADGAILFAQRAGIFRVSASGGKPELVIPAKDGEQIYGPQLLPDGDSVLFAVAAKVSWNQGQIVAQSLSTGKRTVLVGGARDPHYVSPGYLTYASGGTLFAVAFDARRLTLAGEAAPVVGGLFSSSGALPTANYAIANDGTLAYVRGNIFSTADVGLVWVDREGHEDPAVLEPCNCIDPALSPDDTRIATVQVDSQFTDANIWVWSRAQKTLTRLTFEPGLQVAPFWTPDSTQIVYKSLSEGIFMRHADGTGAREELLKAEDGADIWAWTPDGGLIFSEHQDIGVVGATGDREPRFVLATKFNEGSPALSPDGRWLAYQSDESGRFQVYVRPFPDVDSGKWQVSRDGGESPKWAREGHTLFFLGPTALMATAVDSGEAFTFKTPEPLLDRKPYIFQGSRPYDISADGQRFLLMKPRAADDASEGPPEVVIVTNWTERLKRLASTK